MNVVDDENQKVTASSSKLERIHQKFRSEGFVRIDDNPTLQIHFKMATSDKGSRIVIQLQPILFHMVMSKVAIELNHEYGFQRLKKGLLEFEFGFVAQEP
ncbi:hypothetical protein AVEN_23027-1 [Araneus ventricosus]|uniref:Uncharacterized protein n=1 Tax=Araneus ventricosus TaxID=182803 RepID=A0A4Y2LKF2_ARAVE|nr:hypothetical protein AVEN_23027-1 [Araneus ventricosus]